MSLYDVFVLTYLKSVGLALSRTLLVHSHTVLEIVITYVELCVEHLELMDAVLIEFLEGN